MPTTTISKASISQLRHWQGIRIGTHSDKALRKLLVKCGNDVDLAATALMMTPRPAWVSDLLDRTDYGKG